MQANPELIKIKVHIHFSWRSPEWDDLCLFEDSPPPVVSGLKKAEMKIQHNLYEFYQQERSLCQLLIILRRVGSLFAVILSHLYRKCDITLKPADDNRWQLDYANFEF